MGCAGRHPAFLLSNNLITPPQIPVRKAIKGLGPDAKQDTILRSTPAESQAAHDLRYNDYRRNGMLDLSNGMALRVIVPIMDDGSYVASKLGQGKADGLKAIETLRYTINREPDGRLHLQLATVERREGEVDAKPAKPAVDILRPLPAAKHFRLIFLTRVSSADHDMAILTAEHKSKLDVESAQLRCEAGCLWVPKGIAVRPEIEIKVNARPTYVGIDATVRTLNPKVETLQIQRLYGARHYPILFDRTKAHIEHLMLLPGDVLTW